ncbi:uncharacterized protein [Nicotiana tomentosiformis]|uniref:uncharacterized protein n=1 Tax=Nicotiana tomentosiformis TaxID=4098 RepID=UPI00388C7A68
MTLNSPQITVGSSHAINQQIDCNDPLYIHPSDTPETSLVPQILIKTENYSLWRRSMEVSLLVKNKLGFVNGTCTREQYEKNVFQLRQWDRYNAIVQSWIQSSVAKELRKEIVYSSHAQKVWKARKVCFDKVNATKVYHMNRKISCLTQGISNVSVYFSNLNDL